MFLFRLFWFLVMFCFKLFILLCLGIAVLTYSDDAIAAIKEREVGRSAEAFFDEHGDEIKGIAELCYIEFKQRVKDAVASW